MCTLYLVVAVEAEYVVEKLQAWNGCAKGLSKETAAGCLDVAFVGRVRVSNNIFLTECSDCSKLIANHTFHIARPYIHILALAFSVTFPHITLSWFW